MASFQTLAGLVPELEEFELRYERAIDDCFDDRKLAAAAAAYNLFLARAADALIADLGNPPDAAALRARWKPPSATDTWFGPEPGRFLRQVLQTGIVHRGNLPDESAPR